MPLTVTAASPTRPGLATSGAVICPPRRAEIAVHPGNRNGLSRFIVAVVLPDTRIVDDSGQNTCSNTGSFEANHTR